MHNIPPNFIVRADIAKYYIFSGITAFSFSLFLLHLALGLGFYFFGTTDAGLTQLALSGLMLCATYFSAVLVRRIRDRLARDAESFQDTLEEMDDEDNDDYDETEHYA